ncbi:hypothetical protein ACFOET_15365 [Parapedobacter deserti]|uniref:Uncharacterized protein n=1 Tax=Parapedobacter deserti TaxID=1912957 RepID=A0ABV7JUL1_9SPHI
MKERHTYRDADAPQNLPEACRVNPYTVPDGYFEGLHHCTLQKCMSDGEPQTTFAIPLGYFDQLEDSIMAGIAEQKLLEITSQTGFSVPASYFDSLKEQLLTERKLKEKVGEAGFFVPASYFAELQRNITSQTSERSATPVRHLNHRSWVAYAAAACLALLVGIAGVFRLVDSGDTAPSSVLAAVSDQEILNYLEFYGAANDMIYISEQLDELDERSFGEGLSEADIEAYLNHTL